MITIAHILLALASLLTLFVALVVGDARPVNGPDAMGLIIVPLVMGPRWLALAGAAGIAARQSGLGWVHRSRAVQAVVALTWLAIGGAASFASVLEAFGPHSHSMQPWAFVLAVVVPGCVIAALALAVHGVSLPRHWWLIGAGVLSTIVATGGGLLLRDDLVREREGRSAAAAAEAEHQRWLEAQQQKLAALSKEAPLREWLPWLNGSIDELRDPALAAVRSRPTLVQDLASMLRSDDAPAALRFLWLWMPDVPAELADPVLDGIRRLPDWAERELASPPSPAAERPVGVTERDADYPPADPVDLSDMAQASIVLADKFKGSGRDFVTPIRQFHEVLQRHALPDEQLGADRTYQPRGFLRTWLQGATAGRP